jgi:purine-nucleoside phosphorylase
VPLTWWVLFRTRFGLRLRAVGENPAAVDTAGISVVGLRYAAVVICGVLCGLAGAYLATALQAGFVKDMTAGRGFIALAALIFAKWRPWYALMACLLFGLLQAVAQPLPEHPAGRVHRPGAVHAGTALHPDVVIVLAGFVGKAIPPRAGGSPTSRNAEGNAEDLAALIRDRAGVEAPKIGLVLGSGLGHLAEEVDGVAIDYTDLPGFPHAGVSGHNPKLVIGTLEGTRVAVFGGRAHYYESGRGDAMRLPLEVLKALGAEALILTNAAGSMHPEIDPGDLMLLSDHINFSGLNPLIREPTDARFVPMTDAHDPGLRAALRSAAEAEGIPLPEGVYAWYSGPSFETPAEIRAIRILGADAVGMSTVPEVILARFLGLKVAAISTITNKAAGLSDERISHEHTKAMAPLGAAKLERILRRFLSAL